MCSNGLQPARVAEIDRVADMEPDIVPEVAHSNGSSSNGTGPAASSTVPVAAPTAAAPMSPVDQAAYMREDRPQVAPAATAVGLVGQAASESVERPFVPVVDFNVLAETLLGDPEVVLKDKTLMGKLQAVINGFRLRRAKSMGAVFKPASTAATA